MMTLWPQITLLALMLFALGIRLTEYVNNIPEKPSTAGVRLVSFCIFHVLLYFGGFWPPLLKTLGI